MSLSRENIARISEGGGLTNEREDFGLNVGGNYVSTEVSIPTNTQTATSSTTTSQAAKSDVSIYLNTNNSAISAAGFAGDRARNNTLDTETSYYANDLLCEGPIEGLVDSDGSILNYISVSDTISNRASSLSYGIYYNDSPVRDKRTSFLNFSSVNFNISLGNEVENTNSKSSAVYKYDSKIYDLERTPNDIVFKNYQFDEKNFTDGTNDSVERGLISARLLARNFSHYIKNKYVTSATVNIKVDNLFFIGGKGETFSNHLRFVVCVSNLNSGIRFYYFFQGYFVVKGSPSMIPIEIQFSKKTDSKAANNEYIINVYSVEKRLSVTNENESNFVKEFSVDSVIERVDYSFSYPYSVVCENIISAKHFSSVPVRSFDCKLLKIKVPDIYDGDIREYNGDWSGNFSKTLKWTDDPAWIFYDLCSNARYGLAKSFMTENDLNKWDMLKISKFCNELVITNASTKYVANSFDYNNNINNTETDFNTITFTWTDTLQKLHQVYPEKSLLFLYDVKNEFNENIKINFKKIILSTTLVGNKAKLKLCNDFGVRSFIESDLNGKFYKALQSYVGGNPAILNTEEKIKEYALNYVSQNIVAGVANVNEGISQKVSKTKIFDSSLKIKSGKCVARHHGYFDFLEPRFSANIYINDVTEGLKILSDMASIFRGVFYFRNGLLNLTIDVKKPVVYVFTNSNVKDGLFDYASANKETSFTVVKVSYLDKTDNFKDKIVYVEDGELIRKYGLIEKEILGFGITSRYQAERIGKWFLATSKLESQTVSFATGIEATNLKVGDIVRVADNLKFNDQKFGRVTSLDFNNNYIYVDRELGEDILGKKIKLFSIVNEEPLETTLTIFEFNNAELRLKVLPKSFISWNLISKTSSTDDGSVVFGDSSGSASWTRKAYTKQSYTENCQISFKIFYVNVLLACGLSSINDPKLDQTDIDYGFEVDSSNNLYYREGDTQTSFDITITKDDVLKITFDGTKIKYFLNDLFLRETSRSIGNPLYGVAAFNTPYARIYDVDFTTYPEINYGNFANLRSDANFSISLREDINDEDLYRIITITETSINEYNLSLMRFSNQKFDFVDEDSFIDKKQNNKKQIVFSTDDYIRPALTDLQVQTGLIFSNMSYVQAVSTDFDYTFYIEKEVFNTDFGALIYEAVALNFIQYFDSLSNNSNVFGLYCNIIKDGKILKFKVYKDEASEITVFLGEKREGVQTSISFDIDLYAFDKNMRLINV